MRSPSKAAFLRTVALVFLLCIISSVFARAPLVRRQSTVESQWDQGLPAVADGPKMKNNILNEQVVADPYRVCCTRKETLIAKVFSVCEDVTSEAICDGTLYDCPIPASQIATLDIPNKCPRSATQPPSRIINEVTEILPFSFLLCALAGVLINEGPRYNCLEGL